jgi:hypothetical protein
MNSFRWSGNGRACAGHAARGVARASDGGLTGDP